MILLGIHLLTCIVCVLMMGSECRCSFARVPTFGLVDGLSQKQYSKRKCLLDYIYLGAFS